MKSSHTGWVRRTDVQAATKRLLRMGLAVVPGMSAKVLADALDESETLVEGWAGEGRPNHVPAWLLGHPRCPRDLRAFIEGGLRSMNAAEPCAAAPEAQHHIAVGAFGEMLAVVAQALAGDNVIDPTEALRALAPALRAHRLLGIFIEHLQRRAGVTATGTA